MLTIHNNLVMAKSNKIQHTKKALIDALEKSLGVVTTACKIVGIDRTTFYRYLKDDEDFSKKVQEIENVTLDFVESQLHKQIKENSTAATIFFLKTKGKKRGYIERQEIDHTTQGEAIGSSIDLSKLSTEVLLALEKAADENKDEPS
jgi:predicted DNA-binding transcriptional regulator AlpA